MKRILIVTLCACVAFQAYAQDRPNVLIVVADDLGWNDVSFHGSDISTPDIDSMAHSSIILDRFYVTPVCSPTRAGVMTGKYPNRFGMRYGVCSPTTVNGLPAGEKTIADWFEELGYPNRAAFGKWHLGHSNVKYHPLNRGFNYFYGHYNGAIDYFTHKRDAEVDWHRNYESVHENGYSTDLITADVIRYLDQEKDEGPFLAYVAFNAPHSPMQAKQEELERYGYDPEIGPRDDYPVGGQQTGERERDVYGMQGRGNDLRQTYSAMVSSMSQGFGQIIDYLKAEGLFENTIIWFMSDNGGTYRFGGDNRPLRGQKHTEFEGGVRSVSF
ncbi:MAG: sulfatase-like hydrolase/transferase, partial [Marinoscillum sp.]